MKNLKNIMSTFIILSTFFSSTYATDLRTTFTKNQSTNLLENEKPDVSLLNLKNMLKRMHERARSQQGISIEDAVFISGAPEHDYQMKRYIRSLDTRDFFMFQDYLYTPFIEYGDYSAKELMDIFTQKDLYPQGFISLFLDKVTFTETMKKTILFDVLLPRRYFTFSVIRDIYVILGRVNLSRTEVKHLLTLIKENVYDDDYYKIENFLMKRYIINNCSTISNHESFRSILKAVEMVMNREKLDYFSADLTTIRNELCSKEGQIKAEAFLDILARKDKKMNIEFSQGKVDREYSKSLSK